MNDSKENSVWKRGKHRIFDNFALELEEHARSGELPESGDQDLRYCLELQQKRLRNKNIRMQYEIVPRGHFAEKSSFTRAWNDNRYVSKMDYRTCRFTRSFFRDEKTLYKKSRNMVFYQIITDVKNSEAVAKDSYNCPNCGAINAVEQLRKGCSYCGTYFEMSDLFPKVTNFYYVEDSSGTNKEIDKSVWKCVIPCMILYSLAMIYYFYTNEEDGGRLFYSLISGILGGIFAGGISGYFLWVIATFFRMFKNAGKSMPMLLNSAGSNGRFVKRMQRYSPEFSYQYFSDKAVSLLRMVLFSENPQTLPYYSGEPLGDSFANIVEASYVGATALKKFRVQGEYCYVTVDVYMDDIHEKKGRLKEKQDVFRMYLCRNIAKPIDYHFSIKRIQCPNCGNSFDATKQRNCPSCGTRYEIGDADWVVLKIEKK